MHLSYEPDAKRALSGEKQTEETGKECPVKGSLMASQQPAFQIVIVPSYYEPEASRLLSEEKTNELT